MKLKCYQKFFFEKGMNFYVNKFEEPFPRTVMSCTCLYLIGPREDFHKSSLYIHFISLEKDVVLHLNKLEECFLPSYLKELNGSGEKEILKAVTVLLLPVYHVYFPLKYGVALHLIPSQKMPCTKFG